MSLKPKVRLVVVFGPSQFGKSTFINNMLNYTGSEEPRAAVGNGAGESVTSKATTYRLGSIPVLFPTDRIGYDSVVIVDVPGVFDTKRFDNQEILHEIQLNLLSLGATEIDALLVFDSISEDCLMTNQTMKLATDLFGTLIVKSTIVVSTKWDRLRPQKIILKQATLEKYLNGLGLSHVRWTNVWRNNPQDFTQQMETQLSELGSRMTQISPYYMEEISNLIIRCEVIAKQLRDEDPDRFTNTEVTVEENEPEEYTEVMQMAVTEWEPLTEDEKFEMANAMLKTSTSIKTGHKLHPTGRFLTKKRVVGFTERRVPHSQTLDGGYFHSDTTVTWEDVLLDPIEQTYTEEIFEIVETEEMKMPLSFYLESLQKQKKAVTVTKNVEVVKVRTKPVQKIIPVNHERYHFQHYREKAIKYLEDEFRNSIRRRLELADT